MPYLAKISHICGQNWPFCQNALMGSLKYPLFGMHPDMHPCGTYTHVRAPTMCMYPCTCTHHAPCTLPAGVHTAPSTLAHRARAVICSFWRSTGQCRRIRAQGHVRTRVSAGRANALGYTGFSGPEITRNYQYFRVQECQKCQIWPKSLYIGGHSGKPGKT